MHLVTTHYTFHAHCCMTYHYAIMQDANISWEDENFTKFPSKIICFCLSFMKRPQPQLFYHFEVFKTKFNICENQKKKKDWSLCCLSEHINIDLSNLPYYFVWWIMWDGGKISSFCNSSISKTKTSTYLFYFRFIIITN